MMVINNKHEIGDIVYLITDADQLKRIVFSIVVYKTDIIYKVTAGTIISEHYEFEISDEKNVLANV